LRWGRLLYGSTFQINTDINTLISPDLDWRQRDNAFESAFEQERMILAVVEAPTPEFASARAPSWSRNCHPTSTFRFGPLAE